jgi:hypothetical protein
MKYFQALSSRPELDIRSERRIYPLRLVIPNKERNLRTALFKSVRPKLFNPIILYPNIFIVLTNMSPKPQSLDFSPP